MARCLAKEENETSREAQHLVCGYLVRACQQAIYDLALDDDRDPEARRQAIRSLREILGDWREARRAIRAEIVEGRPTFTSR